MDDEIGLYDRNELVNKLKNKKMLDINQLEIDLNRLNKSIADIEQKIQAEESTKNPNQIKIASLLKTKDEAMQLAADKESILITEKRRVKVVDPKIYEQKNRNYIIVSSSYVKATDN